jgi:hypothetical protein
MNKKILIISLIVLIIIITISVLIIKYQSTEEPKTLEQVFTFTNYAFIPSSSTTPNELHQFTKSGKIKSFSNDLSISTDTTSYKTGTTLVLAIFRGTTNIYTDGSAIYFLPNSQSDYKTIRYAIKDITVQEGDYFYIVGNLTSGTLNGTVTVNFI